MQTSEAIDKCDGEFCDGNEDDVSNGTHTDDFLHASNKDSINKSNFTSEEKTNKDINNEVDCVIKESNKDVVVESDENGVIHSNITCERTTSANRKNMDRYEEDMAHDTATAPNTDDLNENISVAATENPMENDKMKQIESKEDQPRSISNIPTNNSSAVSAKYAGNSEIHKKSRCTRLWP